jgi:lysozyme
MKIFIKNTLTMTQEGLNLIISFEGFRSKAYWDSYGKKWTIGYGTTIYPNGQPVRQGDVVTREQAAEILHYMVNKKIVPAIGRMVKTDINQYQLDALTSFAYNCGTGNLQKSTLLKIVNSDPNNPRIRDEFMKWNRAGGRVLKGLARRRASEANLYFKGNMPYVSQHSNDTPITDSPHINNNTRQLSKSKRPSLDDMYKMLIQALVREELKNKQNKKSGF